MERNVAKSRAATVKLTKLMTFDSSIPAKKFNELHIRFFHWSETKQRITVHRHVYLLVDFDNHQQKSESKLVHMRNGSHVSQAKFSD